LFLWHSMINWVVEGVMQIRSIPSSYTLVLPQTLLILISD